MVPGLKNLELTMLPYLQDILAAPQHRHQVAHTIRTKTATCTVGFSWKSASKKRFYVSADHCIRSYETVWRTRKQCGLGNFLGLATDRRPFLAKQVDISTILANQDPKSRKYIRFGHTSLDVDGVVYSNTSVTSREAIPIVGEARPKVGMQICAAGGHFTTELL